MRSARGSLTDAAGSLTDAVLSPLRRSRRESAGPDEAAVSLRQSEDEALLSYLSNHRGACLQSGWLRSWLAKYTWRTEKPGGFPSGMDILSFTVSSASPFQRS